MERFNIIKSDDNKYIIDDNEEEFNFYGISDENEAVRICTAMNLLNN